jgi:hypothetical protein
VIALPDVLAFRGDDPHVQKPERGRERAIGLLAVADQQRVNVATSKQEAPLPIR